MNARKDGGQAFPSHPALYSSADQAQAQGMSRRDWFAGQALAGLLAFEGTSQGLERTACRIADDMLVELERDK